MGSSRTTPITARTAAYSARCCSVGRSDMDVTRAAELAGDPRAKLVGRDRFNAQRNGFDRKREWPEAQQPHEVLLGGHDARRAGLLRPAHDRGEVARRVTIMIAEWQRGRERPSRAAKVVEEAVRRRDP